MIKPAALLTALCALTGCGEPVEGAIPAGRTSAERLALRLAPHLPMLGAMDQVTVQEVNDVSAVGQRPGPEAASHRTGRHRVVKSAVLEGEQVGRLRAVVTAPEAWLLDARALLPEGTPTRVLVVRAGERMLKMALYLEQELVVFSDGRVHDDARLALSPDGAESLGWLLAVPLTAR